MTYKSFKNVDLGFTELEAFLQTLSILAFMVLPWYVAAVVLYFTLKNLRESGLLL